MKKKMFIYYGGFKNVKGGVNSISHSLKEEFQNFFDVSLICLDDLPFYVRYLPHIVEKIINIFFMPLGFYYKGLITKHLYKLFFNQNAHYRIFQDIYISWNSNIASLTFIHSVWSDNLQAYNFKNKNLNHLKNNEIYAINNIDHDLCTVSYPYKNFILKNHFINKIKKKIKVIELGTTNVFKKKLTKFINKESLIYVGTLEARKNVFFLIDVFNKLYKLNNKYTLTIIGKGPLKFPLIDYANKLNLPVNFLGSKTRNEVNKELSKNRIYIHTSVKESFSLSLLEAKMLGLTTVASNKIQVPKDFIDIPLKNFDPTKWCESILNINHKLKKFNKKKYLLSKTTKKIMHLLK
jgi:glycosyltransferase involved in cell wall biosynthesis